MQQKKGRKVGGILYMGMEGGGGGGGEYGQEKEMQQKTEEQGRRYSVTLHTLNNGHNLSIQDTLQGPIFNVHLPIGDVVKGGEGCVLQHL